MTRRDSALPLSLVTVSPIVVAFQEPLPDVVALVACVDAARSDTCRENFTMISKPGYGVLFFVFKLIF